MDFLKILFILPWISPIAMNGGDDTSRGINIDWSVFKSKHNRKYKNSLVEIERKEHFTRNRNVIKTCNKRGKFSCRLNRYSDWSPEELKARNKRPPVLKRNPAKTTRDLANSRLSNITLPDAVDWRSHACMTQIKDQGMCGSCWAFAACTPLEFRQCRAKNNTQIDLSAQNLVDCAGGQYGNYGCDGGIEYYAWDYIKSNGGQAANVYYPYVGEQGPCLYRSNYSAAKVRSRKSLLTEYDIKYELATNGPVAAAIFASFDEFYFYDEGIFMDITCPSETDHSVVIVGYNTTIINDQKVDYWIIRNSWGPDWGMDGYMHIKRGSNLCGIESDASCPIV